MRGGGIDIRPLRNANFKYTTDPGRIVWNKRIFPYGEYFISILQSIPYQEYEFRGELTLLEGRENDAGEIDYVQETVPDVVANFLDNKGTYVKPYYYFGGTVYEILNMLFFKRNALGNTVDSIPNLHDFVDPTGDLDIIAFFPDIQTELAKEYDDSSFTHTRSSDERPESNTSYNQLVDHYTRWLFNQVVAKFRAIPNRIFNEIFAESEPFDYKADHEASFADLQESVGNVWIVRTRVSNMLKIQCIAKFEDTEPNHFIEFVFTVTEIVDNASQDVVKPKLHLIKKACDYVGEFPVQSFLNLITDNVEAMTRRTLLWKEEARHKYYNHVQRLKYLNNLLPKWVETTEAVPHPMKLKPPMKLMRMGLKYTEIKSWSSQFTMLFTKILKDYNSGEICRYDYTFANEVTMEHSLTYNENIVINCRPSLAIQIVKDVIGNLLTPDMILAIYGEHLGRDKALIDGLRKLVSEGNHRANGGARKSRRKKRHEKGKKAGTRRYFRKYN